MAQSVLQTSLIQETALVTRIPSAGKVNLVDFIVLDYDYNSTTLEIDLPASPSGPMYLLDVKHLVRTAFAGGTPQIDIGDGTTTNKYLTHSQITATTAGDFQTLSSGQKVSAKLVAAAKIVITLSASLTAGAGTLIVEVFRQGTPADAND
jgi:hypothetical protein